RGVYVSGANNTIGGTAAGAGNLLSGNTLDGVFVIGSSARNNVIQGNFIGTDVTGTQPLGNGGNGVGPSRRAAHTLRRTAAAARRPGPATSSPSAAASAWTWPPGLATASSATPSMTTGAGASIWVAAPTTTRRPRS